MAEAAQNAATIAVIEGDDTSPEVVRPTVELLSELEPGLRWSHPPVGEEAEREFGSPFPEQAKAMIDAADTTLFGATSGSSRQALYHLRWGKQTFANVRPCVWFPGCASPLAHPDGIDFAIVRENLEDMYVRVEGDIEALAPLALRSATSGELLHEMGPGRYAVKAITERGTERVVRHAFELARRRNGKRSVVATQKHNMLSVSDGYFREVAERVAGDYPDIEFRTYIIDDFACRLITQPQSFDVVVMPNLYGDIMSDAAAGLVGSLGMAASGCYGDDYAYFESAHGTAPDLLGKGVVNPTATLLSACMMLRHLGCSESAERVESGIRAVYADGTQRTPDQGGSGTTDGFMRALRIELGLG